MRARIVLCLLFLYLPVAALAQPAPIKWGQVTPEELAMKAYPADTNATAVILADYGTVEFTQNYEVHFQRHRRIKILKESGYDWGTHEIVFNGSKDGQRVGGVRGQTLKLGPDGKMVTVKMEKNAIFEEKVSDVYRRVKFTLPALEPGAIVEYSYQINSMHPGYVPSWQFQTGEPVLHSEFRFEMPSTMTFMRVTRGVLVFDIQEELPLNRFYGNGLLNRWVMKNVAALREEPYMTSPDDYRAALDFQLASITVPGEVIKFQTTWPDLASDLLNNEHFGGMLSGSRAVRAQVDEITAGVTDPVEKMKKIYDYVRTNINWNEELGFFADNNPASVLKTQGGSGPDIAFLLISMLREADLKADPVLISTRSNGAVFEDYPVYSQFNDVLAHVQIGSDTYLLSATDRYRGYDLLPLRALNGRGWLVRRSSPTWIPITTKGRYRTNALVFASIDSTGTLSATFRGTDAEYGAVDRRHEIKDAGDNNKFARESILEDLGGATVDSVSIDNLDDVSKHLSTAIKFTVDGYAQATGDFLYVNPFTISRMTDNPFKMPDRTFPVDMGYPRDINYTLQMKIPPGYEVVEKPGNRQLGIASGGATYTRSVTVQGSEVTVQTRFVLAKAIFQPRQYKELRELFSHIVTAEAEQVVLKRAGTTAGVTSAP